MARTIVIKNADFSTNKLDTVAFGEIPCTGISLSDSTLAITSVGSTQTLIATPVPANTTDAIVWATSDSDVASVAGGVVTATGCGTATITATCGAFNASCEISVVHIADLTFILNSYMSKDSGDWLGIGELENYATGGYATGTRRVGYNGSTSVYNNLYPVEIPNGATKISISCTGFKPYGFWVDTTTRSTINDNVAFAYVADDNFKYNKDISDSRVVPIPDRTTGTYEGVNACGFVFRCNSTISQEAVDAIVVTFSKDSN